MSSFFGKILYKFKNRGRKDPYSAVGRLVSKQKHKVKKKINSLGKKKALIVPYRMNSASNLFEGNFALFLKEYNYDVDILLCGGEHKYCDSVDAFHIKWPWCKVCVYEQNALLDSYGLNGFNVSVMLNKEEKTEVNNYIASLNFEEIKRLVFRGVNISQPLISAVQLFKRSSRLNPNDDRKIIVGFLTTICKTVIALDNYFLNNSVNFVLVSHGVYSTWGSIQQYCLSKGIHFITWGREYNGAGIIASHNDSYLNEPMYEKNSLWNVHLDEKQRQKALDYLSAKVGLKENKSDYVNYHNSTKRILDQKVVREELKIKENDVVIGLFPNIPWDGQTFRPAKVFKDIESWVFETIEYFRGKENVVLVIRSHPAELHADGGGGESIAEVINAHFVEQLPSNIIILPADSRISSLSVASISTASLLYGSTIGYETMFLKIPTILASDFFYSNKDISHDPSTKEEYFQLIDLALTQDLIFDDFRYENLLKYTYHYQYRRIMPETIMELDGLTFSSYKYDSIERLKADKALKKFLDCCENNSNFYFDELY